MEQEVIISIQPKWCMLIANGCKIIEVRRTKPACNTPFKCYIYCTKSTGSDFLWVLNEIGRAKFAGKTSKIADVFGAKDVGDCYKGNGKVIGEFVCDRIDRIDVIDDSMMTYIQVNQKADMFITQETCLDIDGLQQYLGNQSGFGWHISGLKIYDRPKELNEFVKPCNRKCFDPCPYYQGKEYECDRPVITRPPQSWCYCEGVSK